MCNDCAKRVRIRGAFLGDAVCTAEMVWIDTPVIKVRYTVKSDTACKLVFKSITTKLKNKTILKNDGREHYLNIALPKGFYDMYVSNKQKKYVQFDVRIL